MRGWIKAHQWVFANRAESSKIAVSESGVALRYNERAWDEYVAKAIFPADGAVSVAAVQTLIDVSALIRALPSRGTMTGRDVYQLIIYRCRCAERLGKCAYQASIIGRFLLSARWGRTVGR